MAEYIKREDVHLALDSHYFTGELSLRETIDSVRSADVVERKTGKWIDESLTTGTTDGGTTHIKQFRCSVCGNLFGRVDDKYCGKCGARMEENDGT